MVLVKTFEFDVKLNHIQHARSSIAYCMLISASFSKSLHSPSPVCPLLTWDPDHCLVPDAGKGGKGSCGYGPFTVDSFPFSCFKLRCQELQKLLPHL